MKENRTIALLTYSADSSDRLLASCSFASSLGYLLPLVKEENKIHGLGILYDREMLAKIDAQKGNRTKFLIK